MPMLYCMRHVQEAQGLCTEKQLIREIVAHTGGMLMGASPKTTEFLKECMADALLKTMREKPFAKVTVNEITDVAGVNRSTWFRNFSDKNEAVTFKLIRFWDRWADGHGMTERRRFTLDNAEDFFAFNYSIRDLLSDIHREELQACVYNAFYQVMTPQYGADAAECYEARFYSYGLFGFLDEWIKRGFYETPEQITNLFRRMIRSREGKLA